MQPLRFVCPASGVVIASLALLILPAASQDRPVQSIGGSRVAEVSQAVLGSNCSLDIDCDDALPCTADSCDIQPGGAAGSGTCLHLTISNGEPGDCDDGVFCNGSETCQNGTCAMGAPPCSGGDVCNEFYDTCGPSCTTDNDCIDALQCNGLETCNTFTGICAPGFPPCGAWADCFEMICGLCGGPGCSPIPCFPGDLCPKGSSCVASNPPFSGCLLGRCCASGTCEKLTFSACSLDWFAGDTGRVSSVSLCPPCPMYGAGVFDGGLFTVIAGPASLSTAPHPVLGSPIRRIGDDYAITSATGFVELDVFRFIGGVSGTTQATVVFEFLDEAGRSVARAAHLTPPIETSLSFVQHSHQFAFAESVIRTHTYSEPLVLPATGFVVAHAEPRLDGEPFEPRAFHWFATDEVDVGTNDAGMLWVSQEVDGGIQGPVANFLRRCVGGFQDGIACAAHADCDSNLCESVPGILAFEMVGDDVAAPLGACCNGDTGTCDQQLPWVCKAGGGSFLGVGSTCDTVCDAGACCNPATGECAAGHIPTSCEGACDIGGTNLCTSGVAAGAACTNDNDCGLFQGHGTDCAVNCCAQPLPLWTGADSCEAAAQNAHVVTVPCLSDSDCGNDTSGRCDTETGTCVVTISGDNTPASNLGDADSCASATFVLDGDRGWYEAVTTNQCTYLRYDYCCTDPVKLPGYDALFTDCPCEVWDLVQPAVDPLGASGLASGTGAPYCDEENAWATFGPLPAGTYYHPVYSRPGGTVGAYQLHVTASPCQNAACCYLACTDSSLTPCISSTDCPNGETCVTHADAESACERICAADADCGGGTCASACGLMNVLSCRAVDGWFMGPPDRSIAYTTCDSICETGSCCSEPGACADNDMGAPMDKTACDALGGTYVGGAWCCPGACDGGLRVGLSCCADTDCTGGGACMGTDFDSPTLVPCDRCAAEPDAHCQRFDDNKRYRQSDLSIPGGVRAADDFRLATTQIDRVCVWGAYIRADENWNAIDCADETVDAFHVVVYAPDENGVPGAVVGTAAISPENIERIPLYHSTLEDLYGIRVFSTHLTLDDPIMLPASGQVYWLEVRNDTQSGDTCAWNWMLTEATHNDYSSSGALGGYADLFDGDLAFCLNGNIVPADSFDGSCCRCLGGCSVKSLAACKAEFGAWDLNDKDCSGDCVPPPGVADDCVDAISMPPYTGTGVVAINAQCMISHGPNPVPTELASGEMISNDSWVKYVADCVGNVTFSTCAVSDFASGGFDSVLAVYEGCDTCPDDADQLARLFPDGHAGDENCNGQLNGGGGFVGGFARPGDCFLVRVGGFGGGQFYPQGNGPLSFECVPGCPTAPTVLYATSRYLVFDVNPCAGGSFAIKATIRDMPLAPDRVGESWWAGPPQTVANPSGGFTHATGLACTTTPYYADWSSTNIVSAFGGAIVSGATYDVQLCAEETGQCSPPAVLTTQQWGDIIPPFGGPFQPNFADVSALVHCFQGTPGAQPLSACDIHPAIPNQVANFVDINADILAFQGWPYPFAVPACP